MKIKKGIHKMMLLTIVTLLTSYPLLAQTDRFPDGSIVPEWFRTVKETNINELGKQYIITDYGVSRDSTLVQTNRIQAVVDSAAANGGGVIRIPAGTFLSGSLFFKPGTHLYLEEGAILKGSRDISDFALIETRMEGQTLKYFAALVNADKVDGFTISGKGTLNGNGLTYWKHFWLRRRFNPQCTNMDEMRPRVLYVSNSKNVQISGIRLINSPFWTSHYYKCENLKLLNLYIYAPEKPVKAPSSDAVDLDVCKNVLIKDCNMSVNDDGVVLKGGKGPFADQDPNNGGNYNIIIEDCTYGFCHSALTCGSESIHDKNIIFRRAKLNGTKRVLHLKMRPDTPQNYEFIRLDDIKGTADVFLDVNPWTQFFDLKGENQIRKSFASHITLENIELECRQAFNVKKSDQYELSSFTFKNLKIKAEKGLEINKDIFQNSSIENVKINGHLLKP